MLLSNLKLNDGKLSYTLNTPFNTLQTFRHCNKWDERRGYALRAMLVVRFVTFALFAIAKSQINKLSPFVKIAHYFERFLPQALSGSHPLSIYIYSPDERGYRYIWGERRGSNPRQPIPQTGALPTELLPPSTS